MLLPEPEEGEIVVVVGEVRLESSRLLPLDANEALRGVIAVVVVVVVVGGDLLFC